MPYGQVLEIMVVLLLISSAPEGLSKALTPFWVCFLFFLKSFLWTGFCIWFQKSTSKRRKSLTFLEWVAVFPLFVDFYVIGIGDYLTLFAKTIHLPSLSSILGLLIFISYLTIVWMVYATHGLYEVSNRAIKEVTGRIKLLFPVLLPYIFLSVLSDLIILLPFPYIRKIFTGKFSEIYLLGLLLIFFFLFMPGLIRRLWSCYPLPNSPLRSLLEDGLKKQGLDFSEILVWDVGELMACTAAVIGILPGFRYVLLTPCLIEYLSPEEIEAVLAHEAEHVKRKHILWYLILMIIFSVALYSLLGPLESWLFSKPFFLHLLLDISSEPSPFLAFLAVLPFVLLLILYFRLVIGFFMRNFERQADMAVFNVQGHPFHLISALKKVAYLSGIDPNAPNWHHFSISERIDFLLAANERKELLREHNRRLDKWKYSLLALALILFLIPKFLPQERWRERARINTLEFYYDQLLKQHHNDPKWYLAIGTYFFENKMYKMAEDAYKKALKFNPEDPDVLNNLAWLYIKADDKKFFKPKDALLLAIEAARLRQQSYILDTLAECFFYNGYIKRAIETEKRALFLAKPAEKPYYRRQLLRFKKALSDK